MMEKTELTEKQKKRYDRILNKTMELIFENGFYKLSLSDLTNALRVSRSTIYEHFGSKEGLVEEVVKQYNKQLNEGLLEIMDDHSISIYDKFLKISRQLATNASNRKNYKFHRDLKIHTPELHDIYLQGREERVRTVYQPLIERGIENGLFDPSLKMNFLLQTYLKSSQMVCETDMLEKSSMTKIEALDSITKIFLNGAKKI